MDAPDTVTEAERLLEASGYDSAVTLRNGALVFGPLDGGTTGRSCPVEEAVVEVQYRFEGDSDPGDEMVVFGVRDPVSGRRGTLVSAFGSAADPEVTAHLARLSAQGGRR